MLITLHLKNFGLKIIITFKIFVTYKFEKEIYDFENNQSKISFKIIGIWVLTKFFKLTDQLLKAYINFL